MVQASKGENYIGQLSDMLGGQHSHNPTLHPARSARESVILLHPSFKDI